MNTLKTKLAILWLGSFSMTLGSPAWASELSQIVMNCSEFNAESGYSVTLIRDGLSKETVATAVFKSDTATKIVGSYILVEAYQGSQLVYVSKDVPSSFNLNITMESFAPTNIHPGTLSIVGNIGRKGHKTKAVTQLSCTSYPQLVSSEPSEDEAHPVR